MPDRYGYRNPVWDRDDYDREDPFDDVRQDRERYASRSGERSVYQSRDPYESRSYEPARYDTPRDDYGRDYENDWERNERPDDRGYRGSSTSRDYERTHHRTPYANERPFGAAYAGRDRYGYNYDFGGDNPTRSAYGRSTAAYPRHDDYRQRSIEQSRYQSSYDRDRFEPREHHEGVGGRIRRTFNRVREDLRNWEHRPVIGRDQEIDRERGYVRDRDYRMTSPEPRRRR